MSEREIRSELPRDFEKRQNEVPNKNTLGFKSELRQFPKYQRLSEINKQRLTNSENRKCDFYYKATHILDCLELPLGLRDDVLKNAENFYSLIPKGSYSRGATVLISTSIYITCLERFIFRPRKAFYLICDKHLFDRCLKTILLENTALRLKLVNYEFRKKTILVQLSGLISHYYLNGAFFNTASENLNKYFHEIKNAKNTAITGTIFDLTMYQLRGRYLNISVCCKYLGIHQSTIWRHRLY